MYINGSFYKALQGRLAKQKKIALLVIDEEDLAVEVPFEYGFDYEISNTPGHLLAHSNTTANQQRVLMYMQSTNCSVCSVSHRHGPVLNESYDVTRKALKGLYKGNVYHIRKPRYNAFEQTNLSQILHNLRISYVVVMGWRANFCIPWTIGVAKGQTRMGAIQLGFTVMTCNEILHEEPARWATWQVSNCDDKKLEFYSQF